MACQQKDLWQNEHYEKCMDVFSGYLKNTNMPSAPWYIIDAKSRKWTEVQILETLTQGIEIALSNHQMAVPLLQNVFPLKKCRFFVTFHWTSVWRRMSIKGIKAASAETWRTAQSSVS